MYTSSLQPLSCCNKAPSENWILKSEKLLFSPVVARPSRNIANSSTSPCPRTLTCWDRCSNLDTHPTVQHLRKTVRQKGQNTSKCSMEFVMVCELWSHQQKKNNANLHVQALDSLGSRSGRFALKISSWKIQPLGHGFVMSPTVRFNAGGLTLDEALGGLVEEDKTEALQCFLGNLQAVKSEISWEKRQMLWLFCLVVLMAHSGPFCLIIWL